MVFDSNIDKFESTAQRGFRIAEESRLLLMQVSEYLNRQEQKTELRHDGFRKFGTRSSGDS